MKEEEAAEPVEEEVLGLQLDEGEITLDQVEEDEIVSMTLEEV